MANILFLAGDGIGPECLTEVKRVLACLEDVGLFSCAHHEELVGGAAIDDQGTPLPEATLRAAKAADATLLIAVGGPAWESLPFARRPERGLLGLRKELGLFANLRPALCFDALASVSSLQPELVSGLDILIVRELTGGVYFGTPRGIEDLGGGRRRGINTHSYTTEEIRRVAVVAFDLARARGGRLTSVDKANVMESGQLWREEVTALGQESYRDVRLDHLYADNCAMQLIRAPKQFDVLVTDNLFGDILSDAAAMLTGSLGMLPSASLGAEGGSGGSEEASGRRPALYEPVHGSAPDLAGRDLANPLASILSLAMMLRTSFGAVLAADRLEASVAEVLAAGVRTTDIAAGGPAVSTQQMGQAVIAALRRPAVQG